MPAELGGFCGRCGAPFGPGAGAFCARCGNPIAAPAPVATGYSYPVMAAAAVPGAHQKLSHTQLLLVGGGALAVVVVVITLIAVLARPTSHPCGFYCGPRVGSRLLAPTPYSNAKWGYTVEYDADRLKVGSHDDNGVSLQSSSGDGEVTFSAMSGSDVNGANQAAMASLPSSTFQNIQSIGPVRGAEIGFVQGQGTAYSAQFVTSGGSSVPVGVVIFSATSGNVTITVVAFSQQDTMVQDAPYGLDMGQVFDYPVSNTLWKGQQ